MVTVIRNEIRTARKRYECMASLFLRECLDDVKLTFGELRAVVLARREGWKICPGMKYTYQFNECTGETYSFRARTDIHRICLKYDLYPEE